MEFKVKMFRDSGNQLYFGYQPPKIGGTTYHLFCLNVKFLKYLSYNLPIKAL